MADEIIRYDTKDNEILREIRMTNNFLFQILHKLDDIHKEVKNGLLINK